MHPKKRKEKMRTKRMNSRRNPSDKVAEPLEDEPEDEVVLDALDLVEERVLTAIRAMRQKRSEGKLSTDATLHIDMNGFGDILESKMLTRGKQIERMRAAQFKVSRVGRIYEDEGTHICWYKKVAFRNELRTGMYKRTDYGSIVEIEEPS
jgi:hypothetical protein